MSFKCSRCGQSYVVNKGDVCMSCLLKGDETPSPSSNEWGGNIAPYDNSSSVPVVPDNSNSSISGDGRKEYGTITVKGTIQNFRVEKESRSVVQRFLSSLFRGTAFSFSDERCIFDVVEENVRNINFDSRTGASVVLNGKVDFGTINNNHIVEVVGYRSKKYGVISAKRVRNISNGTTVNTSGQISANAVRIACVLFVLLIALLVVGLVDSLSGAQSLAGTGIAEKIGSVLLGVVIIAVTLKFGRHMRGKTKAILILIGVFILLSVFSPGLIGPLVSLVLMICAIPMLFKAIMR